MIGYVRLGESQKRVNLSLPGSTVRMKLRKGEILSDRRIEISGKREVLLMGGITNVLDDAFPLVVYTDRQEKLLLDLYEKHGDDLPAFIDGQFLVAFHDLEHDTLRIINDHYQATNLYFYVDNELFLFASDLRTLLDNLPLRVELDPKSVPSFLGTGFSCTERTPFKNIFRLLPTFQIICKNGELLFRNRWKSEYKVERQPIRHLEEKLDNYESLFQSSITAYLDYAKPKSLGCLLSGGHDTSFIFLQASQVWDKPIHTFTIIFDEWGFDEGPKAKYITEKYSGIHHPVSFRPEHLDLIPDMVRSLEEPSTSTSLPLYVCMKEARNYVDVILTGDAGDTLWDEYYPVSELHRFIKYVPAGIRKAAYVLNRAARRHTDWERLWELEHVLSVFSEKEMYKDIFRRLLTYRHYNDALLREILDDDKFPELSFHECKLRIEFNRRNFTEALIEAKMYYGVYMYLVPHAQRTAESFGVKFCAPYLNRELIQFISSIPRNWLNGGSSIKKLINDAYKRKFHKQALLRYLPRRYVFSVQQSFDVPYQVIFKKRPDVLEALLTRLKQRGWYKANVLDRLFYELENTKYKPHEICELKNHAYRIYTLLTLEVWCMEFLDDPKDRRTDQTIPLEEYLLD